MIGMQFGGFLAVLIAGPADFFLFLTPNRKSTTYSPTATCAWPRLRTIDCPKTSQCARSRLKLFIRACARTMSATRWRCWK